MDLGVEKDKATYYCWAEGLLTESNKLHFLKSQVTIRTAGHRDSSYSACARRKTRAAASIEFEF